MTHTSPDLDQEAVRNAYETAYQGALAWIGDRNAPAFSYRGVCWTKSLRKPLVDCAYPAILKKRIGEAVTIPPAALNLKRKWKGPLKLKFGARKTSDILIFADPQKTRGVVKSLSRFHHVIYYSAAPAPKLALWAFCGRHGFFQSAISFSQETEYRKKAQSALGQLEDGWAQSGSLPEELGSSGFAERFLPKVFFDIDQAHHFFKSHPQCRVALMDEDVTPSKNAFAQVARQYGVKTLVLCHGVLGHKNGFLPLEADYFLAWGRAQKKKLVRWGAPADRVLVSGCLRYEAYEHLDPARERAKLCARHGLRTDRKLGILAPPLFIPGRYVWEKQMTGIVDQMMEAAKSLSDIQWVVRLHAGDPRENRYRQWMASPELAGRAVLETAQDPYPLIVASDFVLTYYSTFAVDGFAMKKPVVLMRDPFVDIYEEYREHGIFLDAADASQAIKAVRGLFSGDQNSPRHLDVRARQECLNEGAVKASEIIAAMLDQAARGKEL